MRLIYNWLTLSLILSVFSLSAQQNQPALFKNIQSQGDQLWNDDSSQRGDGYKPYKRWEWFNQTRLDNDGSLPPQGSTYMAWQDYKKKRRIDLRSNISNWSFIGPTEVTGGYQGMGRVTCIAFHPTMANTYFIGTPSGGIWKTTDDGQTWTTNTDQEPTLGVSSIVINPNNPDSMYALTGDGDRGSLSGLTGAPRGDSKTLGVIISTDGGATWDTTGLNFLASEAVLGRKLLMDPTNSQMLICATGTGIYRTEDAGKTWSKSYNDYFIDIEFHPTDPSIVYATTLNFSGNCKLYKSTSNGMFFVPVYTFSNGSRAALATTPDAPNSVYILVAEKTTGSYEGLYKSTNKGSGITQIGNQSTHKNILGGNTDGSSTKGQGTYDLIIEVENNDSNVIYTGGVNDWKSTNGGTTFNCLTNWWNSGGYPEVHADKHFFAFNPLKSNRLYECNDGGVYYTDNKGLSWTEISEGLHISQLYKVTLDNESNPGILGGSQDNGTYGRTSTGNAYLATGGDGMECHTDQSNDARMYAAYARGVLYRNENKFYNRNATIKISDNIPGTPIGSWVTPFQLEPKKQQNIVAGYADVMRSTNYGNSWTSISSNFSSTGNLTNIALSITDDSTIYASDFYRLWVTFDLGANWNTIRTTNYPVTFTDVVVDPYNDSIIYLTYGGYNDNKKVEKVQFNGTTWDVTNLTGTLPNVAVNTLVIDSNGAGEMYIGTDLGIFYRTQTMTDWDRFSHNLPNVVVTDLDIAPKYRKLYAATYGRGIWVTALEETLIPVVFTPPHNSVMVDTNVAIKILFNKNITKVNNTEIYYTEGNNAPVKFTSNMADITFNANEVTIKPDHVLPAGRVINISVAKGTFEDADGLKSDEIDARDWAFSLDGVSDISHLVSYDIVNIYPSPASNQLNIKFKEANALVHCTVTGLAGNLIYKSKQSEGLLKSIDISQWQSGIYLISLSINNGITYQFKVVKE